MDGLEDGAALAAVQLSGQRQDAAGFRIEELHPSSVPDSRPDFIFRMIGLVVPFHGGWQPEDAILVVRAYFAFLRLRREQDARIIRAFLAPQHTGFLAHIQPDATVQRLFEPVGRRGQEVQQVEQDGTGRLGAGHACHAVPVGVAAPHAYGVVRRHAYGPGVPGAVARAGFPGGLPHGADQFPVNLIGPVDFFQGFERVPERQPVTERGIRRKSVVTPDHVGIGAGDVGQGALTAAQDQ